jgi:hypothetical protein
MPAVVVVGRSKSTKFAFQILCSTHAKQSTALLCLGYLLSGNWYSNKESLLLQELKEVLLRNGQIVFFG